MSAAEDKAHALQGTWRCDLNKSDDLEPWLIACGQFALQAKVCAY